MKAVRYSWYIAIVKIFYNSICRLPTNLSLRLFWNFGSLLGVFIVFQIISGFLMTFYYTTNSGISFDMVQYLIIEANSGWFFRIFHMNGSSVLFFFLYIHIFKGLFINRYKLIFVWMRGLLIFVLIIGIAFIGYSLVWSQMSYWAVVVITSLVSVIPYVGLDILIWVWGGYSVGGGALKLFFSLHFLLPFLLLIFIMIHLLLLHTPGSSRSLGYNGDNFKIVFNPLYRVKDLFNFYWLLIIFLFIILFPFVMGDCELFLERNNLVRPVHIAPEWYFCRFYAILRSIPNKILGVLVIIISLLELGFLSLVGKSLSFTKPKVISHTMLRIFLITFLILIWLGQGVAETPFVELRFIFNILYFLFIFLISMV